MIAGRDLVAEMLRRRSDQPLQRQQLFGSNDFVGAAGQQIDRQPQARELDPLPQGDEASTGQFVALVQFLDDFEVVSPGNIDGP